MTIYKITNLINNKIYIGYTTQEDIKKRLSQHISKSLSKNSRCSPYLKNAIRKYGKENFIIEIIENNINDFEILCKKEDYWIEKLNSRNRDIGYNLKKGGSCGQHSEETIEKIRKSSTGRFLNEESKKLLKERITGTKRQFKEKILLRRKVIQIDALSNKQIKIWDSLTEASNNLNIDSSKISAVCKGKSLTTAGFKWKYYENERNTNEIIQIDPNTNEQIKVWHFKDLKNKFNLKVIRRVCVGRRKFAYGFKWEYNK